MSHKRVRGMETTLDLPIWTRRERPRSPRFFPLETERRAARHAYPSSPLQIAWRAFSPPECLRPAPTQKIWIKRPAATSYPWNPGNRIPFALDTSPFPTAPRGQSDLPVMPHPPPAPPQENGMAGPLSAIAPKRPCFRARRRYTPAHAHHNEPRFSGRSPALV